MEPKGAGVVVKMPRDRKAAGTGTVARSPRAPRGIPRDADKGLQLLQVRSEHRAFDDLIVGDAVREWLVAVIDENKATKDLLHTAFGRRTGYSCAGRWGRARRSPHKSSPAPWGTS